MNVGNSVKMALKDWLGGESEAAMLHACNAIDGTAKKRYPNLKVGLRFKTLLRDHYEIFGPMALPGIDMVGSSWEINSVTGSGVGGIIDTADVIYGIHRCTHGHGDELPEGFKLMPDAAVLGGPTSFIYWTEGKTVQLSDRVIFGLLAVAVLAPENRGQRTLDEDCLIYGRQQLHMRINEWWGHAASFHTVLATDPPGGPVTVRF